MAEKDKRDRPRASLEDILAFAYAREDRRISGDPGVLAGIEWRNGRMTMRRSEAEHLALRRTGDFEDLLQDAWRSLLYGKTPRVDWFLQNYMSLYPSRKLGEQRTREDLRVALFWLLRRQWADRPALLNFVDPTPLLDPASPNPKGYLYDTVAKDAHKLWVKRRRSKRAEADRAEESAKVHKPIDELTPDEALLVAERFETKELVREQMEEEIAELGLTPRETEVARLAVWGKNTAEIAAEMGIAASTVREHRKNIAAKVERGDAC